MGVCSTPWFSTCTLEGNKFWFYSLCISICGELWDLYHYAHSATHHVTNSPPASKTPEDKTSDAKANLDEERKNGQIINKTQKNPHTRTRSRTRSQIILKIIENAADLFIPGAVTGWIVTNAGIVAVATVVSTILSAGEIWERVGEGER
ncbi:hypothetical protein NHQ30_001502 [Ciborinia camelliae]|nr:hypothetical protein NHQ30_001502 [Ciborinia camelliae]